MAMRTKKLGKRKASKKATRKSRTGVAHHEGARPVHHGKKASKRASKRKTARKARRATKRRAR